MIEAPSHRNLLKKISAATAFGVMFYMCLIGSEAHSATDSVSLEYAGSTLWTGISDAIIDGRLAYLAMLPGVRVVDLSDPENLRIVGDHPIHGRVTSLAELDGFLYVLTVDSGLIVLDATNPSNPVAVGSYTRQWWWASHVHVAGNIAYIYGDGGLEIVDISERTTPKFISSIALPEGAVTTRGKVRVRGEYAYVTSGYTWVIDVSEPSSPKLASRLEAPYDARSLALQDSIMLVADGSRIYPPSNSRVAIYSISDPASPTYLGQFGRIGDIFDVSTRDSLAFIATDDAGLLVLDISDPTTPTPVSQYPSREHVRQVLPFSDKVLLVQKYDTDPNAPAIDSVVSMLSVLSLADLDAPALLDAYPDFGGPFVLAPSDQYCYAVTSDTKTIGVIEIHSSGAPVLAATANLGFMGKVPVEDAVVQEDYLLVAMGMWGLATIDVSDPLAPSGTNSWEIPGWASSLAVSDSLVFMACGASGVFVFQIDEAGIVVPLQTILVDDWAADIVVWGGFAYVACRYSGLEIFDISNLLDVQRVATYPSDTGQVLYNTVAKVGKYVCASGGGSIFHRIDVSVPQAPQFAGEFTAKNLILDLKSYPPYLAVAAMDFGVQLFCVQDADSAYVVGEYATRTSPLKLAAADSFLFVSDWANVQRLVLKSNQSFAPDSGADGGIGQLYQNFPNPFNGATNIQYVTHADTFVDLSIYNILGQKVITLVQEFQPRNRYITHWTGIDDSGDFVSSGVYLCRLRVNEESITNKIVVLR